MKKRLLSLLILSCTGLLPAEDPDPPNPVGLMLTWQSDPTTTMTIDWQRRAEELHHPAELQFRPRGEKTWQTVAADRIDFPFSTRKIDRVELTGLRPGSEYEFRGDGESPVFYFRTAPERLEGRLRLAVGGDMRHRQSRMEAINRVAIAEDPDIIYLGGDYAYADGLEDRLYRWYEYFDAKRNSLITPDGRVPPVIGAIGNHEVRGGYTWGRMENDAARLEFAPYYYALFAFPGLPGYGVLDFGDYLSLVVLDSDHTNEIPGAQTDWLRATLAARRNVPHVLPTYHVPAYPSHRSFDDRVVSLVRENWPPLFDEFGIRLAFEHHDHLYKRTHPIRNNRVDPEGVVYMGDGAWGVWTRDPHPVDETWYLAQAENTLHVIMVDLYPDRQELYVLNPDGERIDETVIHLDRPVELDSALVGLGPESLPPSVTRPAAAETAAEPDRPSPAAPETAPAPGDGQLVLSPDHVTLESGEGNPGLLLSEQKTIGDPLAGSAGRPSEGWRTSWQFRDYPVTAIIDLEKPHRLTHLYHFDANNDGLIRFEADINGEWTEIARDDQKLFNRWVGHELNVTTRRLRFISYSRVIPNEIVLYGTPAE
jgi:hypothetical protein